MKYYTENGGPESSWTIPGTSGPVDPKWSPRPAALAEAAADDYHSHHDGWEGPWPLLITLLNDDGTEVGVFEVDREMVPSFWAREVKKS